MARLIDADAMRQDWLENGENEFVYDTNAVLDSIDAQTTVDAVEVVHCKDCRHSVMDVASNELWCDHCKGLSSVLQDDDFCSYGAKMDLDQ